MTVRLDDLLAALTKRTWQALSVLALLALLLLAPAEAQAQTYTFNNTVDSDVNGINDAATPCNNYFTRTFVVSQSATITDVNFGVLLAHTYRGDLLM